jgi:cytochrome c oxidase cbb3-type subunit 3
MSRFWSTWVIVLVVLNIGLVLFLFVWAQIVKIPTSPTADGPRVGSRCARDRRKLPWWWVVLLIGVAGCFAYLFLFRVGG